VRQEEGWKLATDEKTRHVSIRFRSTYRLASYYDAHCSSQNRTRELKLQYDVPDFDRGGWNYTREEFDREVAGSVGILHWTYACGELIPLEVFEAFKTQYAINFPELTLTRGRYEQGQGWQRECET
jgi:hypothetical protein